MDILRHRRRCSPFSGENWDPLEDAIRFRVRAFIEAGGGSQCGAGRPRYQRTAPKGYRNGHRHRQLAGTFGALTVSLPRVRLLDGDGRSQTIQAYKRLTKRAEAIIANTYLAGTNTRPCPPSDGRPVRTPRSARTR